MRAIDVITIGEAMALLVAEQRGDLSDCSRFSRRLAGAETNVAIGLARLGFAVSWVSRVGNDAFGRYIRRAVESEGVDCSHVACDARYASGMMLKAKAEHGADPAIEYFRKGSAASHLSVEDFDAAQFRAARHMHATGIAPALSETAMALVTHALDVMRGSGKTISFDPNLRPSLWPSPQTMIEKINQLAAKARWVLPGLGEGRILTGRTEARDIAAFYLDLGVELVVVKLGPAGAYFRSATDEGVVAGVPVANVVDTVGAGDGFAVGVISALLEGLPTARAVQRGNQIGALAVQVEGDMEGLPTRARLDAVQRRQP